MKVVKMKVWKKFLIILTSIILLLLIIFISYKLYWRIDIDRRYNEFEKIQTVETKGTLSYVQDENYSKVENMDYITQDEIGVKIDSISITDDTLCINTNFKFDKEFNYNTFSYGYAIYDENNNIYQISSRQNLENFEKYDYNSIFLQRELGVYGQKDVYSMYLCDSSGMENKLLNGEEKTIVNNLKIEAKDKFPLSQKIYIKIFDLGYFTINKDENGNNIASNTDLSNAKWLFEFDIPEEMNNRKTINLKLANEIPGLKITSMTLTETKLVINLNSEEYMNLITVGKDMPVGEFQEKIKEMLSITDEDGNVYQELGGGTTGKENEYKMSINATKKDLAKKLFINFKVGDEQYKSELIKDE